MGSGSSGGSTETKNTNSQSKNNTEPLSSNPSSPDRQHAPGTQAAHHDEKIVTTKAISAEDFAVMVRACKPEHTGTDTGSSTCTGGEEDGKEETVIGLEEVLTTLQEQCQGHDRPFISELLLLEETAAEDHPHGPPRTPEALTLPPSVLSTLLTKTFRVVHLGFCPTPLLYALQIVHIVSTGLPLLCDEESAGDHELRQRMTECFPAKRLEHLLDLLRSAIDTDLTVVNHVQSIFFTLYLRVPPLCAPIRALLFERLTLYTNNGMDHSHTFIAALLRLLAPIVKGLRAPLSNDTVDEVLFRPLLPLVINDKAHEMSSRNDPVETYKAPLCALLSLLLEKLALELPTPVSADAPPLDGALSAGTGGSQNKNAPLFETVVPRMFQYLLEEFKPKKKPLQACGILSVLEELGEHLDGDTFPAIQQRLLRSIAMSCASDHAVVAAHGFKMWYRDGIQALSKRWDDDVIRHMTPALLRSGIPHWKPEIVAATVKVMQILRTLTSEAEQHFQAHALEHFEGSAEKFEEYMAALAEIDKKQKEEEAKLSEEKAKRECIAEVRRVANETKTYLQLAFGRVLGSGSYSVVRFAKRIEPEVNQSLWMGFAVKVISKTLVEEQRCVDAVEREIAVQSELSAPVSSNEGQPLVPGVLPLLRRFEDKNNYFLMLPFCPRGDLYDAYCEPFTPQFATVHMPWVKMVLLEVAETLAAIHNAGYFYGDLKPENILIGANGHIQFCDFGASRTLTEASRATQFAGTLDYLHPTVVSTIFGGHPSAHHGDSSGCDLIDPVAADWWSYGCFAVQLICGDVPFVPSLLHHNVPRATKGSPIAASSPVEHFCELIQTVQTKEDTLRYLQQRKFTEKLPPFVLELLEPRKAQPTLFVTGKDQKEKTETVAFEQHSESFLSILHNDPFFESVQTFSSVPKEKFPKAPPKSAVVTESKNTGRKQSMMWRQNAVTAAAQTSPVSGHTATLSLPQEKEGTIPLYDVFECRAIDDADALEEILGGPGGGATAASTDRSGRRQARPGSQDVTTMVDSRAAYGATASSVSQYFTVMPRRNH